MKIRKLMIAIAIVAVMLSTSDFWVRLVVAFNPWIIGYARWCNGFDGEVYRGAILFALPVVTVIFLELLLCTAYVVAFLAVFKDLWSAI